MGWPVLYAIFIGQDGPIEDESCAIAGVDVFAGIQDIILWSNTWIN